MSIVLVTGGSRSGKSEFAEKLAEKSNQKICYIATTEVFDDEMANRVKKHQSRRGNNWDTLEIPYKIDEHLGEIKKYDTALLDCLTMLVSNKMFSYEIDYNHDSIDKIKCIEEEIIFFIENMLSILSKIETKIIVVTNEVGLGIIPENRLSRVYRDIVGKANQIVAKYADEVYFVVSGIPMKLKG